MSLYNHILIIYVKARFARHYHSPLSLAIITRHHHSPPSLAIITRHYHSPLSLAIITRHHHSPLSLATITRHHHSPLSLATTTLHLKGGGKGETWFPLAFHQCSIRFNHWCAYIWISLLILYCVPI